MDKVFFGDLKLIMLSELATICSFKIVGGADFNISGISTLKNATNSDISFFGNRKYLSELKATRAGAVIISETDVQHLPQNTAGLVCSNVMLGYAKALDVLCREEKPVPHICETARVHESAKIGEGCYIGNNVFIGENVKIGDNSVIGHNSVIEANCRIDEDAQIGNNVSISHSIIGKKVIINSGARIGESGFGIIPTGSSMVYVKQIGRVIIGDRVRIGANTTIDRGSLDDTSVGNDTIIDNLVQLGHNVVIGAGSIIVAQVGIAGSTKIGNGVVLAGQVGVSGHLEIGDRVVVAAKSGVAANIESGSVVGGIPAVDVGIWKRQVAFLKNSVTRKKV